ncbi:hypothetical protein SAMN04488136_116110 [Vibrio xiamenensis]|uniref:Uncharacterized protein n=1 Tax=Vibrio xiamenensis TaxID=861298 RepID=A0A1G8CJZ2_9VIBR|nr:hypothetical protein [Vibrio xiamenensis]SDH45808.1 hypothetical protein SAMN04488136_116110 [Vibrio xiamenensis]
MFIITLQTIFVAIAALFIIKYCIKAAVKGTKVLVDVFIYLGARSLGMCDKQGRAKGTYAVHRKSVKAYEIAKSIQPGPVRKIPRVELKAQASNDVDLTTPTYLRNGLKIKHARMA